MRKIVVAAIAAVFLTACAQQGPNWEYLFNGHDLTGWSRVGGEMDFAVVDGVIVGTARYDTPNSFLRTDREFGDFILEFEFKITGNLNSGVQFRSFQREGDGRVQGYQFEIDPIMERAWTGGIFDEARRGWLYPLTFNQKGRTAYKGDGVWNTGRLEAIGNSIRGWINGIPTCDLIDDMTPTGFIALQVHSINRGNPNRGIDGATASFRNIRILTEDLERWATPQNNEIIQINAIPNTLSERELAEGWELLWDGKTTNGWHGRGITTFPENGWVIEDGLLTIEPGNEHHIMTNRTFGNFWLTADFRITRGASSGILYLTDARGRGPEFQIIDDVHHPRAYEKRTTGSLFEFIHAPDDKPIIRWDTFNTAWIKVRGNHVEHWLNGVKLFSFERNTPAWNEMVSHSRRSHVPDFGNLTQGHILLQNSGSPVSFRNIKIKELNK